jgi:hypothetical protein
MTEISDDTITGTISITVLPQENGSYICSISSSLSDQPRPSTIFYGQTKEHALAIALEHLALEYRTAAEESQGIAWDDTETEEEEPQIDKRYHVILHYERIQSAKSKFEALRDTMLGNTVVENAESTVIKISPHTQQQTLR